MNAARLPEPLQFTDQWQYSCNGCGASRPFQGRVAARFSRKTTLGWCSRCRSLKFFSVEPLTQAAAGGEASSGVRLRSHEGVSLGLTLGAGVGLALGAALDSIAIGVAIGCGAGLLLGAAFDARNQGDDAPSGKGP